MILSEDQTMIRNMTRRFANERLAPRSSECDRTKHFPEQEIADLGALGMLGVLVRHANDGAATDQISYALALAEIAVVRLHGLKGRSRPECRPHNRGPGDHLCNGKSSGQ